MEVHRLIRLTTLLTFVACAEVDAPIDLIPDSDATQMEDVGSNLPDVPDAIPVETLVPDTATSESDQGFHQDGGTDSQNVTNDGALSDLGTTPCPTPFQPSPEYLELCRRSECCFDTVFDPAPVELRPHSVEWTTAPVSPLPECVIPDPEVVIVRAYWTNFYGDPPIVACAEAPCGGYCFPSTGKVYLLNVRTLSVKYLGDEDWANWGPFTGLEPVPAGYKFQLSSDQSAIFRLSGPTVEVVDGVPQAAPWAACFLGIRGKICLHFPLQAEPGDCPLHLVEYSDGWGECRTWE